MLLHNIKKLSTNFLLLLTGSVLLVGVASSYNVRQGVASTFFNNQSRVALNNNTSVTCHQACPTDSQSVFSKYEVKQFAGNSISSQMPPSAAVTSRAAVVACVVFIAWFVVTNRFSLQKFKLYANWRN